MRLRGQLNPGEYVIVATRQHPGALLPSLTCLLLGIAAAAFASTARSSVILWWVGTIAAAAFFIGALRIGWRWLTTGYLITTHRLVVRRGLVTRTGDESLYLDSLGQRWVREGAPGSWLGYGSVYVVCRTVCATFPPPNASTRSWSRPTASTTPCAPATSKLHRFAAPKRTRGTDPRLNPAGKTLTGVSLTVKYSTTEPSQGGRGEPGTTRRVGCRARFAAAEGALTGGKRSRGRHYCPGGWRKPGQNNELFIRQRRKDR